MNVREHDVETRHWEQGSVLVLTLVVSSVIGVTLGGYLLMVKAQASTVARSQAWNNALVVAEAGVEEALAQLNPGPAMKVDRTANGWGLPVDGIYGPKTRSISNDTYSVVYTSEAMPTIYSTGTVAVPFLSTSLTRVIKVTTTNEAMFTVGIVTKRNINMNGNGIFVDSFNSNDQNLSTGGRYDPTKTSTNGDVASLAGVINVGNATIKGSLYLGPNATDSINANGIVTGTIHHDFNADFPDVVLPDTFWSHVPLMGTNVDGVSYTYYFGGNGDYLLSAPSASIYVAPKARVRLFVPNSFNCGNIRVAGGGKAAGSLQLYVGGLSFSVSGATQVDGGICTNLIYFGLPSNRNISMGGNSGFVGLMYAPEANLTLGGGGSNLYDFVGACVLNSLSVNGHYAFHFDESALDSPPWRGYVATSWKEL